MAPRVVIVGGGFAGIAAARILASRTETTLIDAKPHFTFKPLLEEYLVGTVSAGTVKHDYDGLIPSARFVQGLVTSIDYHRRTVTVDGDGTQEAIAYDYLLIAVGSSLNSFGMDVSAASNIYDDESVESARVRMRRLRDAVRSGRSVRVGVIGGGAIGVGCAGLIRDFLAHHAKSSKRNADFSVSILNGAGHLLPGADDRMIALATDICNSSGIELVQACMVTGVTRAKRGIEVSYKAGDDERTERFTEVFWSAGMRKNAVGTKELAADPYLRLKGSKCVFVAGDCARITPRVPELAQTAMAQGRLAARNILRSIKGTTLERYVPHLKGTLLTLGNHREIGSVAGRILRGQTAWFLHRSVFLWSMISLEHSKHLARWVRDLFSERYRYLSER